MTAPRARWIDWPSLAMALVPLVAIGVDAWGVVYYRQGRRNEMLDLAPSAIGVAIVLSLAIAGLGVRGWKLTRRGDPRTTFFWLLLPLMLLIWPAAWAVRPMPIDVYRRGLADWAGAEGEPRRSPVWAGLFRAVFWRWDGRVWPWACGCAWGQARIPRRPAARRSYNRTRRRARAGSRVGRTHWHLPTCKAHLFVALEKRESILGRGVSDAA